MAWDARDGAFRDGRVQRMGIEESAPDFVPGDVNKRWTKD
jgi:hypothetical protein